MALEQRIATMKSFHNGVLVRAGQMVTIDTDQLPKTKKGKDGKDIDATPNFVDPANVQERPPYVAAPIGPTGPNPAGPHQIPHDAVQVGSGYIIPGDANTAATPVVGETASADTSAKAKK